MNRRSFNKLLESGLVAAATPWALRSARADEPIKVGFVYLGPVGDFGWTYQHDVASQQAEEHFAGRIKTAFVGMRSVNPTARLKFIMINSWYDPGQEGHAAKALIDQGCDIITQHTDSPTPLQVASSRNIKAFGEATDMAKFAPNSELSANGNVWGPYYIQRIQGVLDGTDGALSGLQWLVQGVEGKLT